MREIGITANRRLLGVQRLCHNPIRAAEAFTAVHEPIVTSTGARIAGLRVGDRRAHTLLQAFADVPADPCSHRYRLTDTGLHHAMLLTHLHTRLLLPGLAHLADPDPPAPSLLRTAARNYQRALEHLTHEAGLAA